MANTNETSAADVSQAEAWEQLQHYTLAHRDPAFIHQHVVDARTAQHADERTKPIALAFALIGLYLRVEHGRNGRQVQQAHMRLARRRRDWPAFPLPAERGSMTAVQVFAAPAGTARDRAIDDWCAAVWRAFAASHDAVAKLLRECGEL
jgi:Family of unknown function (DUF5946)